MAQSVSLPTVHTNSELTLMSIIHIKQNLAMHSLKRVTVSMDTDVTLSTENSSYLMKKANGKKFILLTENFSKI